MAARKLSNFVLEHMYHEKNPHVLNMTVRLSPFVRSRDQFQGFVIVWRMDLPENENHYADLNNFAKKVRQSVVGTLKTDVRQHNIKPEFSLDVNFRNELGYREGQKKANYYKYEGDVLFKRSNEKIVQFSSVYLDTIHYEVQHKKKLSHGKGAQKKPWGL